MHIASGTVEEGVKGHKQSGKFNEPRSILIKIIQLDRRYLNCIEYGDGKVMLNSVAPLFELQSVSYCASSNEDGASYHCYHLSLTHKRMYTRRF